MQYRRFGRTDLRVPAITFGGGWDGDVLNHKGRSTAFTALDRAAAVWQALGEGIGTPAQASLRFGLACPQLSTIVVGMAELDHMEQALAAEAAGPLPEAMIADLVRVWQSHAAFTA